MYMDERNYTELIRPWMAKRLPLPSNYFVPGRLQREAEHSVKALFGDDDDIEPSVLEVGLFKRAQQCLTLLSERLGDQPFFFGKRPTSFDALVFSYLAPLVKIPFPNANHLKNHIAASGNLNSFVNRVLQNYFPTAKDGMSFSKPKAKRITRYVSCVALQRRTSRPTRSTTTFQTSGVTSSGRACSRLSPWFRMRRSKESSNSISRVKLF